MKTNRHFHLPSMTLLLAFEAAARCRSFKAAALELSVTPASVSQNIKRLEDEMQLTLFIRGHRQVILTEQGQELFNALEAGFGIVANTFEALTQTSHQAQVRVGALAALSSYWLMPRMTAFLSQHPHINVHQISSNHGHELIASQLDLWVQYGKPNTTKECGYQKLFRGRVIPAVSPEFAASHPVSSIADLAQLPLIHMDTPTTWLTWPQWFAKQNYPYDKLTGPKANNYLLALEMATNGAGLVLGWQSIINPLLSTGKLVPLTDLNIPSPEAFYLVWSTQKPLTSSAQLVRDWLLQASFISD